MSRLSFRPRPLDIHKKLPILKSVREFEDDDPTAAAVAAARAGVLLRHSGAELTATATATDGEGNPAPSKKNVQEIPTPQFNVVETYERDYTRTFAQPTCYIRARGARAEIGEFVEYDLDNEDEDWLEDFNNERKNLNPEKLEVLLFKLEILDHKARERAGAITPTFIGPVPVLLQLDAAMEALQYLSVRFAVFQAVYNYWKAKREQWQKPILRHLQPPPPVNDTNPYNVFRPREKAHRLHARRMQRRENNIQSFEKLRLVITASPRHCLVDDLAPNRPEGDAELLHPGHTELCERLGKLGHAKVAWASSSSFWQAPGGGKALEVQHDNA